MMETFTKLRLVKGDIAAPQKMSSPEISMEEALGYTDGAKVLLFQSVPGAGKSCLMLKITITWGEAILENTEVCYPVLKGVKSLLYLRPDDCKSTLAETVKETFVKRCGANSEAAIHHFNNKPEETAIVWDSLDEIYDKKDLINDLEHEMGEGKRVIIAGVRTNHPVLNNLQGQWKQRFIEVQGFDQDRILQFVGKFCKSHPQEFSASKSQKVKNDFQAAVDRNRSLCGLLTIPLVLTMVCLLIMAGKIASNTLRGLTKLKIYELIEELVCERDGLNPTEQEMTLFHKFCLLSMFKETNCYEKEMCNTGIDPTKIPFILLGKKDITSTKLGRKIIWPHLSFMEYGAAKYLKEVEEAHMSQVLKFLSSKPEFSNTFVFLLEMIDLDTDRMIAIVNDILALQSNFTIPWHIWSCSGKSIQKLLKSISGIHIEQLLESLLVQDKLLSKPLVPCARCWKKTGFASTAQGQAVINIANSCLSVLPSADERKKAYKKTIFIVLPTMFGEHGITFPVPSSKRSVKTTEATPGYINLYANRPIDFVSANIFTTLSQKVMTHLECDLKDKIYSHEDHATTPREWLSVIEALVNHCHAFDEGTLLIKSPVQASNDDFLLVVLECHQRLIDHGVNQVEVGDGDISVFMDQQWKAKTDGKVLIMNSPGKKLKVKIRLSTDKFGHNIDLGMKHAEFVVKADRMSDVNMEHVGTCFRLLNQTVKLRLQQPDGVFIDSNIDTLTEEWKTATNYLRSCSKPGQLTMVIGTSLSNSQTVSLNLQLQSLGITHQLDNDEVTALHRTLCEDGWSINGGGEYTLKLSSPDGSSQVSVRYKERTKLYLDVAGCERSVCIEDYGYRLHLFYSHPTDLATSVASCLTRGRQLERLSLWPSHHDSDLLHGAAPYTHSDDDDEERAMVEHLAYLTIAMKGLDYLWFSYEASPAASLAPTLVSVLLHLATWFSTGVRHITFWYGTMTVPALEAVCDCIPAGWHTQPRKDIVDRSSMYVTGPGGMKLDIQLRDVTIIYSSGQELAQGKRFIKKTGICHKPEYEKTE